MAGRRGRKPKVRRDYAADVQDLLTLSRAIDADVARDEEWRRLAILKLKEAAQELLQAPDPETPQPEIAPQAPRKVAKK